MLFKSILLSLAMLTTNAMAASNFRLVTDEKDPAALKLLSEVNAVFPDQMKDIIDAQVRVKFSDLNKNRIERLNESCDQKLVLGQVSRFASEQSEITLHLDRVLLEGVANIRAINCSHKDTFTYAKAIAVHELSHLYDQKKNASKDITFLNLSGWVSKGLIFKKRTNLNNAMERSPDPYEFKNPEETFAVNFEFFLLDKTYKCRRPSFYRHYVNLLGFEPMSNAADCEMNKKVTLISQSIDKKPNLTREIDPSRIYQIHYLFAGKGKEMMSRWGHAMYRLIICAPGREVGEKCLQDFSHHVVVSYRANIEEMTMDYKKGIDGSYASQLFLMNMNDVVNEYTKGEFRDVISLPINMSKDQIKLFTNKLLENYWSYKGSYFFLTNNCASEAMNLLRAAYPGDKLIQKQAITTPLGLYDFLAKKKFINTDLLNNTKEAIYLGYLFPGVSEKLMASLRMFVDESTMSFEKFALELKAPERKVIYERALALNNSKSRVTLLAHAIRLEDQILLSREQQFAKKIGDALFGSQVSEELKNTVLDERIIEMRDEYKKLSAENFIVSGYGIPLKSEFKDIGAEVLEEVMSSIQGNSAELKEIAAEFFPEEVTEMQKTLENRFYILTELSKVF